MIVVYGYFFTQRIFLHCEVVGIKLQSRIQVNLFIYLFTLIVIIIKTVCDFPENCK